MVWDSLFLAPHPSPISEKECSYSSLSSNVTPVRESHSAHPIYRTLPTNLQSFITLFYFLLCTSHCLNLSCLFICLCQVLWHAGPLNYSRQDQVFWQGVKPGPLALGAGSFSHHTTREFPLRSLLLGKDAPLFSDFFVITILLLLLLKKPDHPFSIWIWPTVSLWRDLTHSLSSGVPFSWLFDLEP